MSNMEELFARLRAQSKPSLINPTTATIKEDIKDAIKVSHSEVLARLRALKSTVGSNVSGNAGTQSQEAFKISGQTSNDDDLGRLGETSPGNIQLPPEEVSKTTTDKYGNAITYNEKQQRAVDLGGSGQSCVIIGAAGTGKTTCQKGLVTSLIQNDIIGLLDCPDHNHLISGSPGVVIVAYTRRAVANIRRNMPADLQANCITIHKLLEYQPDYIDYMDEEGNEKTKMVFAPKRNEFHPLPSSIHTIIYEESSMLGTDLYKEVQAAMPHKHQEVFLGDIQQLPPVFGPAILGFKLLELPVVELTDVYRQALDSPIIRLAHRVLSGKGIPASEFPEWKVEDKLTIHPWKGKFHAETALTAICTFFTTGIDNNIYIPEEDIILCPFNKSFGTDEINKKVANHLARKRGAMTYEIIAGFNKYYFSPGDKVLFDKEDATILEITTNPAYSGKAVRPASTTLDYWGNDLGAGGDIQVDDDDIDDILLKVISTAGGSGEDEGRKKKSSHSIKLRMNDSDTEVTIDTVGDINSLGLGYALTIHKSQGSEWRKVFFVLHQSHATMVQRELLYTGITRAREELYIICETDSLEKGIKSQRVKGDTLAEKAEFFKGKQEAYLGSGK